MRGRKQPKSCEKKKRKGVNQKLILNREFLIDIFRIKGLRKFAGNPKKKSGKGGPYKRAQ